MYKQDCNVILSLFVCISITNLSTSIMKNRVPVRYVYYVTETLDDHADEFVVTVSSSQLDNELLSSDLLATACMSFNLGNSS